MERSTYKRMPLREMKRWKCRLSREVRTKVALYPAGTEVRIFGKRGGLHVDAPPCEHCGIRLTIRKLEPWDVELVERDK